MKKGFIYISILAAAVLASCVKNPVGERTLSGTGEKTPIVVVSNVNANTSVTKAVDGRWEANDVFMAYIKHVTTTGTDPDLTWKADVTGTGVGPRLANFKISGITSGHEGNADNYTNHSATSTLVTTDSQGLYWDDFSNSANTDYDLRTEHHALMSYYGYCYNGGSPNLGTELNTDDKKAAGEIGWTVAEDQTSGFKTSDLLFSGQQIPVAYSHGTASGIAGRNRVLSIPYFHAMSKVTIVLNLEDGFNSEKENLASTTVTLQGMNTVSTVTAPTLSVAPVAGDGNANVKNITAQPISTGAANLQKSFSALIAPTVMKAGKVLAKIVNIDGNNYDLVLTDAVLKTAPADKQAWNTKLATYNAPSVTPTTESGYNETEGGITIPGVHYMITVTIKKQQIKVEATINDWDTVNAQGYGTIKFVKDVTDKTGDIAEALKTNGFDIYKSASTTFGAKETSVSWNESESKWEYSPDIYWANSSDNSYFRALSGATEDDPLTDSVNESLAMSQGQDVLWGTTAAHSGTDAEGAAYNYKRGAIINPRTGNVPLEFEHPMSKITVNLSTTDDASAVTLAGAKISIANIYDGGTINLNDGSIADLTASDATPIKNYLAANAESGEHKLSGFVVIPQPLKTFEDETPREGAIAIYPETNVLYESFLTDPATTAKTSIGTGTPAYYLISQLTSVPATLFTGDDTGIINEHNGALPGAVSESTVKEPARLYTLEEFNTAKIHKAFTEEQFNSIPKEGKIKEEERLYTLAEFQELVLTEDQFNALPDALKAKKYTAETAAVENAKHLIEDESGKQPEDDGYVPTYDYGYPVAEGDEIPGEYYSYSEYQTITPLLNAAITEEQYVEYAGDKTKPAVLYSYSEYIALDSITQVMFDALPEGLKTKAAVNYTQPEADTYNSNLDGAWKVGGVKVPAYYKLNDPETSPLDNDLGTAGNKIMMYITLADETRYVIDLASCKDSGGNEIEEWQRGKHYTYTISLAKEQITFRAMIKDWVEKTGSGNANLEWD